ncbi:Transcription factor [Sporothrix bragantina]|uniref:Transcription factor n=1 Tax=Sporothrix bragantina TaxID=671064 RepID=A0ABP0BIM0_9PEZI
MRLIVHKLHTAGKLGGDKLIKYYRCLFQAALYRDNDAAFQVLEQVKRVIDDELTLEEGSHPSTKAVTNWPEHELQFLAATAFNEGIDWFAGGQEDQARHWVLAASNLADKCHDGGKLKNLITSQFRLLNIGDLEVKQSVESDPLEAMTVDPTDVDHVAI